MAHESPFEPAHQIKVLLRRPRLCKYAGSPAHTLPAYRREKLFREIKSSDSQEPLVLAYMTLKSPFDFGTYRTVKCRRLRRACANMQTCQSLRSHRWHPNRQYEILVPLLHCRATKAQESMCKCANSPAPSLLS